MTVVLQNIYLKYYNLFIDATNKFVNVSVSHNNTRLRVNCRFINQPRTGIKSCAVTIRPACARSSDTAEVSVLDYNTQDIIVNFDGISVNETLCFNLTARNDTKTVIVRGRYYSGKISYEHCEYKVSICNYYVGSSTITETDHSLRRTAAFVALCRLIIRMITL